MSIFSTLFYIPVYNLLIVLINTIPGHSAGVAVIAITILIRLILFPLSRIAIKTQLLMRQIEPELAKIRTTIKDRQEQAQATMKLYKDKGINPFASFFLLLIQLPILLGLYRVFRSNLPKVDTTILYKFVHVPTIVVMSLVGNTLTERIIFALLAVITQFIQINLSLPKTKKQEEKERTFQSDLAYSMNVQMRFILPLIMFPIAYVSSVIGLYLITTNTFTILQEIFVRRRMMKKYEIAEVK